MRNDKLIPGAILVIIGVLFLLDNFNVIDFSWGNFFHLWPILLVIAGVNLVFAHNRSTGATLARIAVLVAGMGILIYGGVRGKSYSRSNHNGWNFNFDDNDRNDSSDNSDNNNDDSGNSDNHGSITKVEGNGHYQESYKPSVKFARLNIRGAAASYTLKEATTQLFEAETKEFNNKYILKSTGDSITRTLDFDMTNSNHHGSFNFGNKKSNKAVLKLNAAPEWEINVKAGAADMDFDLSGFKVKKIKFEGGAASFDVKMGQPVGETNLEVSAAASALVLSVPQNAACRITAETGLSSNSFAGFDKIDDNKYQTAGFDKAANKMYIKLNGAVSNFKVKQY